MRNSIMTAAVLVLGLAACGSPEPAEEGQDEAAMDSAMPAEDALPADAPTEAVAMLQTADGTLAGTATVTEAEGGLQIALNVENIEPGEHGVHVHTVGSCEAPTFESAGSHWNPGNRQHGLENPEGAHAGDMPNLTVAQDGTGTLEYTLQGGTFNGLLDEDGSAFVVHAMADDQTTDPSGNSGDRIACGVFTTG